MTGAEAHPPTSHRAWILGVAGEPGEPAGRGAGPGDGARVTLERRELTVVDHGTGEGARVAASLGLDDPAAGDLIGAETTAGLTGPVVDLTPLTLRVVPVPDVPAGSGERWVSMELLAGDGAGVPGGAPAGGSATGGGTPPPAGLSPLARGPWRTPAGAAVDRVQSMLTRARLDDHPAWPHLHGGGVANEHGVAVVVLGRSGAGKSTLIANLAASGLNLLNDEQVSLHRAQGLVGGFTRPVAVKPGGIPLLPEQVRAQIAESGHTELVTAAGLGSRHRAFARPALVVLPDRHDGPAEPSWELLGPAAAVEALAANNLDLTRAPEEALSAYAWLATSVPVVTLRYHQVVDAVPVVLDLLNHRPAVECGPWRVRKAPEPATAVGPPPGPGPALPVSIPAWAQWVDDLVIDPAEERLLLRGHRRLDWPVERSTVRELAWRDRAAFLWAVAVPSASYRAVEGDLVRRRLARLRALARRP